MVWIYHLISQSQVIQGSFDFMGGTLIVSHTPVKFRGHRQCSSGDILVLVCHVMSQDHVIKRSYDFMGKAS